MIIYKDFVCLVERHYTQNKALLPSLVTWPLSTKQDPLVKKI